MLYSPGYALEDRSIFTASAVPSLPMNDEPIRLDRLPRMDPDVVAQVHDRYFDELFRYARYRVSSPDIAEDIVADVFIRLLEAARKGKSPHSNLRGWLLSTCSHAVNDHFRSCTRGRRSHWPTHLPRMTPAQPRRSQAANERPISKQLLLN